MGYANILESQQSRDELAASILQWAAERDLKIALSESLTGGLLSDAFVRIPGASNVFLGSAVTYDIHAKSSVLNVDSDLLELEGAVHSQVARQMAEGAALLYNQPSYHGRIMGLSTTGVAGPGPSEGKPAGLVYVGVALPEHVFVGSAMERFTPLNQRYSNAACGAPDANSDSSLAEGSALEGANDYRWGSEAFEFRFSGSRDAVRGLTVQSVLRTVMSLTHSLTE